LPGRQFTLYPGQAVGGIGGNLQLVQGLGRLFFVRFQDSLLFF